MAGDDHTLYPAYSPREPVTCAIMQLLRQSCCDRIWVGADRAHCCTRTGGCGAVFDDAELFDTHRDHGTCTDPAAQDLVQTKNGIWLRVLDIPR
jgi:hypothetical protein